MKTIKVLHTADWHIGELNGPMIDGQNGRELDTLKCIDHMIDQARKEAVDLILIAGDLFDRSKLWGDTMLKEIEYAADRLRRLADIAPTVLLFGTANHDSMQAFKNLQAMNIPNLFIITGPELLTVNIMVDEFANRYMPVQIGGIPGFDKGYFRVQNPGMATEEENQVCSQMLGDIVLGLSAQIDPEEPAILMAHYTVIGCQLDNGEHVFMQSDIVLPKAALLASNFNFVCLGHIHRAQKVEYCGRPVFYSGPPSGLTFNEEGQAKGFWIHEYNHIKTNLKPLNSGFIETPARQFHTLTWDEQDVDMFVQGYPVSDPVIKDKIVRLHYTCSEELNKQLNRKALEKSLYDAGAFYVAEIRPAKLIEALQKESLAETAGPLENLAEWLTKEGFQGIELAFLIELARPLVATVSAKMPTGKLSGIFRPKRLEVRNYRSYREESFDFEAVHFAIVNGPNGVGKSAFFGDAISDCLYEETREGDLTGWISNLPEVKSGAIIFEFAMGNSEWRVTRTRVKSGKTTLALAEKVNEEWENRGFEKKDDTQKKIISLLGMDAMTFRSCALIMQDAYGLFLEADKEERMQILGNLLGLSIYEQLAELAKVKVTDINRSLEKDKSKLAELDQRLTVKPLLDLDLKNEETALALTVEQIQLNEQRLSELTKTVNQLTAKSERIQEIQKQLNELARQIKSKESEKIIQQSSLVQAQEQLKQEPAIIAKAAEYDQTKEKIAVLKTKQPRLKELAVDGTKCKTDMQNFENQLNTVVSQITDVKKLLDSKSDFEEAAVRYRTTVDQLNGLDDLERKYNDLQFKLRDAQNSLNKAQLTFDTQKNAFAAEIKTLSVKIEMLGNSNCINSDEAHCRFLADAQEAKKKLVDVQAKDNKLLPSEVEQAKGIIKDIEQQISVLKYDPIEHKQLKALVADLRPKAEKAAELSGKAELLETLTSQETQLMNQKKESNDRYIQLGIEFQTLNKELQPLPDLEKNLFELAKWVKAKDELPGAKQIVKSVTEIIDSIDKEVTEKQEQINLLELDIFTMNQEVADLPKQQSSAKMVQDQIKELQVIQNNLHSSLGALKSKLDSLAMDAAERTQIAKKLEPLAQELVRYQTLYKAFDLDGIPFSIVRSVVSELSTMANDILGQMTGGKMTLEMRTEKIQKSNKKEINVLEIWITDYIRGSLPYRSRSGGQKVKSALSVAFALADLKARRAGIQLGMMFVDEPPFLDADGTEAYCDALELLGQRYLNMMVIAISHDPAMKARFPQEIQVEDRGEDGSKVRLIT